MGLIHNTPGELAVRYPLDRFLPDTTFATHPKMPMPQYTTEPARAVTGLAFDLAARHVAAEHLAELAAAGKLNLQVLLVPPQVARRDYPPQYGLAGAAIGLKITEDTIAISGSRAPNPVPGGWTEGEPTSEVRYTKQETDAGTLWLATQATGLSRFRTYGTSNVPVEGPIDSFNSAEFDRLERVSHHLGFAVAGTIYDRVEDGHWMPQVLLDGQLVEPPLPAAVPAA